MIRTEKAEKLKTILLLKPKAVEERKSTLTLLGPVVNSVYTDMCNH